ncbi:unnamed protein product [Alopecurus aequalis]
MSPSHSLPSAAALSDDDIVTVFLRIPPDDPTRLVRASLVCKDWRRILTGPEFCRLYREFHRTPPMLGFVVSSRPRDIGYMSRFVPTTGSTAFRLSAGLDYYPRNWRFVDSRHGRILVGLVDDYGRPSGYIVWDPITNGRLGVPSPATDPVSWTAAVLCAKEHCDHLGCHGQPFLVGMVFYSFPVMSACVYSSESGVWSDIINLEYLDQFNWSWGSALARNTLYFPLVQDFSPFVQNKGGNVLQYKFGEQKLSVIELPSKNWDEDDVPDVFISAEDDMLVFAGIDFDRGTRLSLWSTKDGAVAWVKRTVIDLETLLPPRAFEYTPDICGFAEGVVFLTTEAGLFTVELSSGSTKKVAELERVYNVIPWISFHTPDHARLMMPQP